jgi:hypothetical protein
MLGFWLVLIVFAVIAYAVAFTRKGSVATARLGDRRLEVLSSLDPQSVFERISLLRSGMYAVDDKDPNAKIVVLSSPVTFASWGFLYPVFIHAAPNGTRIEIGCHSKVFQMGPLVTRAHKGCVAAIENVLAGSVVGGIPAARIA